MNANYWLSALVWSAVGFTSGYAFAKVRGFPSPYAGRVGNMNKLTPNKVVGAILVVLALVTVGQSIWLNHEQRKFAACQEKVNKEIRQVARQERRDYFETWRLILNATNREASKKIFQEHLDRGDQREAQRDAAEKTRKRC